MVGGGVRVRSAKIEDIYKFAARNSTGEGSQTHGCTKTTTPVNGNTLLVSFPSFLPPGTEPRHLITHGDRKRFPSGPTATCSQKRTNEEEKKDEEGENVLV